MHSINIVEKASSTSAVMQENPDMKYTCKIKVIKKQYQKFQKHYEY